MPVQTQTLQPEAGRSSASGCILVEAVCDFKAVSGPRRDSKTIGEKKHLFAYWLADPEQIQRKRHYIRFKYTTTIYKKKPGEA